ncbi:hypothetical protein ATO2_09875 [Roseovarius sp. 22II1-1F6A]|nr:hypothetical protein ATO2_09875 [Roseovarius sp. 22II1-1F6A]
MAWNERSQPFTIRAKGRVRWALEHLIDAGRNGCTPIERPGPRWAAYVYKLRGMGLRIETVTEAHEGDFSGNHARYVLRSRVQRLGKRL